MKNKKRLFILSCIAATVVTISLSFNKISQFLSNDNTVAVAPGKLTVEFLDVGNADCSLVILPNGSNMLIDAGNNADSKKIVDYLKKHNINKIDYLVGTHPHEDHIGGLDDIINNFQIGTVFIPQISEDDIPASKTYHDVLEAITNNDCSVIEAKSNTVIFQDENTNICCLSPERGDWENLNNYSAVIKLTYHDIDILFMGDAESEIEEQLLESNYNIDVEILKVAHHGSSTSSTKKFIEAVSPKTAFIPCGKGNSYNHPHSSTLNILENSGATVYRADKDKTVIITCDETSYSVSVHNEISLNGGD